MAGWAIGAASVAAVVSATVLTVGMSNAAERSAEAQERVAETNAKATVAAAKEAANAQIQAAKEDSKARMHESDLALQQEQEYLAFEERAMNNENDMDSYYRSMQNQIDDIDTFYSEDSSWGIGQAEPYDYGGSGEDMQFS
jgi:hypothetical protein